MGQQVRRVLNEHPGKLLYHYTNATGVIGILTSNAIWASSAYHLNDSKEYRYALEIVRARLRERLSFQLVGESTQEILDSLDYAEKDFQVFIASFSEEPDLLSQWYAYGGGSSGYAVGLRFAHLRSALRSGFRLMRCIYKTDEHQRLADWIIEALQQAKELGGDAGTEAAQRALLAAAAMKHPGFEREREWRLVRVSPVIFGDASNFKFRSGRCGIVPFIEAPLYSANGQFAPVSMTVGPNDDPSSAEFSLKCLLANRGLYSLFNEPVQVLRSATPFRP